MRPAADLIGFVFTVNTSANVSTFDPRRAVDQSRRQRLER
jgi:hypothetical protein